MSYTRRNFLKATLGSSALLSLSPAAPNFLVRSMMAAANRRDERDTVLVVVQLSGGNDGLNTVVPYQYDEYARNRPTLRLPPGEIHKIDSHLGFHPRMGAFMRLYEQGYLSIIQGVGYPNTDRSHESGMRVWHTATPDKPGCQTGWPLDRRLANPRRAGPWRCCGPHHAWPAKISPASLLRAYAVGLVGGRG